MKKAGDVNQHATGPSDRRRPSQPREPADPSRSLSNPQRRVNRGSLKNLFKLILQRRKVYVKKVGRSGY